MNSKFLSNLVINNKIELSIAILTLFIFSINILDFPFQGEIYYAYIGQELLRLNPVFSTSIAVKPPIVYFFDAFLMKSFFFLPNYLAIRIGMLILSSVSMVLFYKVLKKITRNNLIPIFSILITLSFVYFIQDSLNSGLKPIILFFIFLEFLFLFKKNYFISGFFASLCFMTWQPSGLLIFGPIVYCFLNKDCTKKYFKILIGFSIPLVLIIFYFFFNGLLAKFIEYVFVFPLTLNLGRFELLKWLKFKGLFGYYNTELIFILFSLFGVSLVLFELIKRFKSKKILPYIKQNKKAISFIFPFFLIFLYSIFDFQGSDDVIILLPAISLFTALFLSKVSKKITVPLVVCFILLYGFIPYLQPVYPENPFITDSKEVKNIEGLFEVAHNYSVPELIYFSLFHRKGEEMTLEHQMKMAEYIRSNTADDEKIFSMGAPELLFLSNRRNINEYFYLTAGYYKYVEKMGFSEDLREDFIEESPKFIVSRNVWMNERVIDTLDIREEIEDNYIEVYFHPEYVIWERKK